jgi:VanZ family protein
MKTKPSKSLFLSWIPALIGMGILFYASSLPGDKIHLPPFPYSDKAVHFCVYAILGMLIASRKSIRKKLEARADTVHAEGNGTVRSDGMENPGAGSADGYDYKAVLIGAAYGFSDEVHQRFVPMRSYDYVDMTADALGVALGCWIYLKVADRLRKRRIGRKETGRERANPGGVRA